MSDSKLLALAQLLRLPNVFTAVADVLLGYLVTTRPVESWPTPTLLALASSLLYLAGMVLNDWFDRAVDAAERPSRPIPSGRISAPLAAGLGVAILSAGVAIAWMLALRADALRAGWTAVALAAAVLAYDGFLKRTPLGPLGMGACRTLNVLLGMSVSPRAWLTWHYALAGGIGLYIVGVTVFARTEATRSNRLPLVLALVVMWAGLALVAAFPRLVPDDVWPTVTVAERWELFWVAVAALVGWRCLRAVGDPSPERVQQAVRSSILSLIVIDAGAVTAVQDVAVAVSLLALFVPTLILGRWIYST